MSAQKSRPPIDQIRDASFSMAVGDEHDGEITEAVSVADQDLYLVKDFSIYKVISADEIDPERTNVSVPNSNQKIASSGSDSEIVSRSFLTANTLFNVLRFDPEFDRKQIMDIVLVIMKELLAAEKIQTDFLAAESTAVEGIRRPKERAFNIPAIDDLAAQIRTYVQKIEHATQALYWLTQVFYDHEHKLFDGFAKELASKYGSTDEFTKFSCEVAKFMVFVRNTRHCIEHPKTEQKMIVKDFSLSVDGTLSKPSVEIVHDETPQSEMPVRDFVQQVLAELLSITEALMVHLASKHMVPFGRFDIAVGMLPADQCASRSKVRVGYLIDMGDGWVRFV